ncbi:hypothetical protein, partial [Burkholderia sp. BCC1630]|uniref:hypothetical protein n=1 Tax=Burkholderia sp. BCC1630 TaxID=2676304 RepID=UPI001ABB1229
MFIIQLIKTLAPDTVTGYFRGMQNCLKAAMSLGADVSDMTGFDIALVGKMRGYIVRADGILSHRADWILSRGGDRSIAGPVVDKCMGFRGRCPPA